MNVTHLGRSHYSNTVFCNPGGCNAFGGRTVVIITAANGDQVFGFGTIVPGQGTTVELDGGTGRFAGATGNYVVGGPPPFVIDGVFFLEFTQTGTIKY